MIKIIFALIVGHMYLTLPPSFLHNFYVVRMGENDNGCGRCGCDGEVGTDSLFGLNVSVSCVIIRKMYTQLAFSQDKIFGRVFKVRITSSIYFLSRVLGCVSLLTRSVWWLQARS